MKRSLGYSRFMAIGLTTVIFSSFLGGCFFSSEEEEIQEPVAQEETAATDGEVKAEEGESDISQLDSPPLAAEGTDLLSQEAAAPLAPAPVEPVAPPLPASQEAEEQRQNLSGGDFGAAGTFAASGLPEIGSKMVYIVKKGDTLGKISKKIFGSIKQWKQLTSWNSIEDVNRIYPGEVIYYQLNQKTLAFAIKAEKEEVQVKIVVEKGQTLGAVAEKFYGSSSYWPLVWRQNGSIRHPDKLEAGSVIFLTLEQKENFERTIFQDASSLMKKSYKKTVNSSLAEKQLNHKKVLLAEVILENV